MYNGVLGQRDNGGTVIRRRLKGEDYEATVAFRIPPRGAGHRTLTQSACMMQ